MLDPLVSIGRAGVLVRLAGKGSGRNAATKHSDWTGDQDAGEREDAAEIYRMGSRRSTRGFAYQRSETSCGL